MRTSSMTSKLQKICRNRRKFFFFNNLYELCAVVIQKGNNWLVASREMFWIRREAIYNGGVRRWACNVSRHATHAQITVKHISHHGHNLRPAWHSWYTTIVFNERTQLTDNNHVWQSHSWLTTIITFHKRTHSWLTTIKLTKRK